jgi:hypothetical protein
LLAVANSLAATYDWLLRLAWEDASGERQDKLAEHKKMAPGSEGEVGDRLSQKEVRGVSTGRLLV